MHPADVEMRGVSPSKKIIDGASLCAPSPDLNCFGCCPPIRPAHYEPLDYVRSLRREFLENRLKFLIEGPAERLIVGYSCWALGCLDSRGRRIGCLLHPSMHGGKDLRNLTGYGAKCRRESCSPAVAFDRLPNEGRQFWLALVNGLSPFYYSSRKANPLFHLMLWGPDVLEPLRTAAEKMEWTVTELLAHHPFLLSPGWTPKAHRYLFRLILAELELTGTDPALLENSCRKLRDLLDQLQGHPHAEQDSIYTHLLPLEHDFLDFLRLGLRIERISLESAVELQTRCENAADSNQGSV
jgi:hypothetical protein